MTPCIIHHRRSRPMNVPADLKYTASHEWIRTRSGRHDHDRHHRSRAGRRWAISCSSSCPRSGASVEGRRSLRGRRVGQGGLRHLRAGRGRGRRGQRRGRRRAGKGQRRRLRATGCTGSSPRIPATWPSCSTPPPTIASRRRSLSRPEDAAMPMNEPGPAHVAPRRVDARASSSSTAASSTATSAPTTPTRRAMLRDARASPRARALIDAIVPAGDSRAASRWRCRAANGEEEALDALRGHRARRTASQDPSSARATTAPTRRA